MGLFQKLEANLEAGLGEAAFDIPPGDISLSAEELEQMAAASASSSPTSPISEPSPEAPDSWSQSRDFDPTGWERVAEAAPDTPESLPVTEEGPLGAEAGLKRSEPAQPAVPVTDPLAQFRADAGAGETEVTTGAAAGAVAEAAAGATAGTTASFPRGGGALEEAAALDEIYGRALDERESRAAAVAGVDAGGGDPGDLFLIDDVVGGASVEDVLGRVQPPPAAAAGPGTGPTAQKAILDALSSGVDPEVLKRMIDDAAAAMAARFAAPSSHHSGTASSPPAAATAPPRPSSSAAAAVPAPAVSKPPPQSKPVVPVAPLPAAVKPIAAAEIPAPQSKPEAPAAPLPAAAAPAADAEIPAAPQPPLAWAPGRPPPARSPRPSARIPAEFVDSPEIRPSGSGQERTSSPESGPSEDRQAIYNDAGDLVAYRQPVSLQELGAAMAEDGKSLGDVDLNGMLSVKDEGFSAVGGDSGGAVSNGGAVSKPAGGGGAGKGFGGSSTRKGGAASSKGSYRFVGSRKGDGEGLGRKGREVSDGQKEPPKLISMAELEAASKRRGVSIERLIENAKAKGFTVES